MKTSWFRNAAARIGAYLTSWEFIQDLTVAFVVYFVIVQALHVPYWVALVGTGVAAWFRDPVAASFHRILKHRRTTDMGWSDGNDVFDPTITALLRIGLTDHDLYRSAHALINALQQQDWDTESESFDEFRTHLPIVAAFYNSGVNNDVNETEDAYLDYDPDRNEWRLTCNTCHGVIACAPFTVEGHDQLLNVWSFHDVATHGGGGKVEWPDMFLTPSPDEQPALLTLQVTSADHVGVVVSFPRTWSVKGCDGSDPDRFVVEFTRPAPADHSDIRATDDDDDEREERKDRAAFTDAIKASPNIIACGTDPGTVPASDTGQGPVMTRRLEPATDRGEVTVRLALIGFVVAILVLLALVVAHKGQHIAPAPSPTVRVDGACWGCGPRG